MTVDMRLAAKGKSEPREALTQQGRAHIQLAKQYADALIESGWSEDDTTALERAVAKLEETTGTETDTRISLTDASDDESPAVSDAKSFIRRLRNALPRALRESQAESVNAEAFETGDRLGRSASKIAGYLGKIRPSVEALDPVLAKHFGGKKASETLDAVKSALEKTDTSQDSSLTHLPEPTLSLYETKGRVLEMVEDLNRAGRIAFEGQAETVGKFNKDILLRARRDRASKAMRSNQAEGASSQGSAGKG